MSVDYYLYSPSAKKAVMIWSIGLSGTKVGLSGTKVWEMFIRWAIENSIKDIVFVNEDALPEDTDTKIISENEMGE